MSHEPPIYPQTQFSFPEHFYHLPQALQPGPEPSNFFAQPPNSYTGFENNFNSVPPAAAAALSRARLLHLPNVAQQLTASTSIDPVQQAETEELMKIIQHYPPEQVEELFAFLQANAAAKSQSVSSTTNGPPPAVSHHQPSASLPTNLPQTADIPSFLHPAGQGLDTTSTTPTIANSTEDTSTPAMPSAKALGKRRARSDSTEKEAEAENGAKKKGTRKIAKSKATKVLSNMGPPSVPALAVAAVQQGSSGTLSSFGNIPPPEGPAAANALPAAASYETRPAKRPRKRKAKVTAQASETPAAGMSSMQSVFRASATGLPAQNNNKPGQVQWPPQILPQVQQLPSYFPPGMTVSANGEYTMAPTQNNGALASQSRYPPSQQQPISTPASSSRVKPSKRMAPLEMDHPAVYRLKVALEALTQTGNLRVLYPLLCYRPVQELMKYLLRMVMGNKCVGPTSLPRTEAGAQNPSGQVNNNARSVSRAGHHDPSDSDNVNVRISQKVRRPVRRFAVEQSQMQMIPQNVGSNELSGSRIPCADPASQGYNPAPQPNVDTHQVPHNTGANFLGHFHDNGSSTARPSFEGGAAQPEVEVHQASADTHNAEYQNSSAPSNDVYDMTDAENNFDFNDLTWDDVIAATTFPGVQSPPETPYAEDSLSPVGSLGAQSNPVNVNEIECAVVGQAVAEEEDSNIPGASEKQTPASEEATPVDVAGNDNNSPGEFATNASDLTQNTTSIDSRENDGNIESFVSALAYNDTQAIDQMLYGDRENDAAAHPFHMFGSDTDIGQDFYSGTGQQEGSYATSETRKEPADDFDMYMNF